MNIQIHIKNEQGLRTNWLETHPKLLCLAKAIDMWRQKLMINRE